MARHLPNLHSPSPTRHHGGPGNVIIHLFSSPPSSVCWTVSNPHGNVNNDRLPKERKHGTECRSRCRRDEDRGRVTVKNAPGFVVNRILIPMINEVFYVLAKGVASPEDIDAGMKLGCNHPIGPLATTRSEERRVGKECRSRWSPYH